MTFASPKNICMMTYIFRKLSMVPLGSDLATFGFRVYRHDYWHTQYIWTKIPFWSPEINVPYLNEQYIIDQNDSFRYFRLLMSTWRDSICENTFETSHVRFIHENFIVLITTPLDQIQQNLLRKETCQTTVKPVDIVLQTWFEEYPTPP